MIGFSCQDDLSGHRAANDWMWVRLEAETMRMWLLESFGLEIAVAGTEEVTAGRGGPNYTGSKEAESAGPVVCRLWQMKRGVGQRLGCSWAGSSGN